jgi:hypothetical protein
MILVYPSCFSREGIWHLNRHAQRRSVALHSLPIDRHASGLRAPGETRATHKEEDCALQYSLRTTKRAGFAPSWCSATKVEAKQPDNAREAYEPQAKRTPEEVSPASAETHNDTRGAYGPRRRRVLQKEMASHPRGARRPKSKPNNLTTRVRRTLRQSAPQKRSLPPLRKLTTTRVGSTGPVGDAYHKKSWLRTLVVLGDQSLSLPSIKERTSFTTKSIDRHASGLRAPGETRAIQKKRIVQALQYTSRTIIKSWLRTLVVLGDQNRSQTIDRHASGLQASGETRATHKEEDCTLQHLKNQNKKKIFLSWLTGSTKWRSTKTWDKEPKALKLFQILAIYSLE